MPNDTQFARTAERDPFGKLDDTIEFRFPGDVKLKLQQLAAECGYDLAEFCRLQLYRRLFGVAHVKSVQEDRLDRAIGNVGEMQDRDEGSSL